MFCFSVVVFLFESKERFFLRPYKTFRGEGGQEDSYIPGKPQQVSVVTRVNKRAASVQRNKFKLSKMKNHENENCENHSSETLFFSFKLKVLHMLKKVFVFVLLGENPYCVMGKIQ